MNLHGIDLSEYLKAIALVRNRLFHKSEETDDEFVFLADDLFPESGEIEDFEKHRKDMLNFLCLQASYTSMVLEHFERLMPGFDAHLYLDESIRGVSKLATEG